MRQIVELSGAELRNPDIHAAITVREKRDDATVTRDGSRLLDAIEVGDSLKRASAIGLRQKNSVACSHIAAAIASTTAVAAAMEPHTSFGLSGRGGETALSCEV